MLFDHVAGPVALRAFQYGVDDVANGEYFVGDDVAEGFGDLLLAFEEQSLESERADFLFVQGSEDHVQRDPVGCPAHHQAEERQYPPALVEIPDGHLNQAEQEAEIEPGVDDETEFHFPALDEDPVQQPFVLGQAFDDHAFDVEQVFDVVGNVTHQVVHQLRGGLAYPVVDHVPG